MYGKEILKELTAYQQGKQVSEVKKEFKLDKIVKLASNENPYGFSETVRDVFLPESLALEVYPDGYASDLRSVLAKKLDVGKDELVFGNGSDELISLLCRAFLDTTSNTVMAKPTFIQYRHNSLIKVTNIKEDSNEDD